MASFRLGASESGPLEVDLEELIETRLLVTATSGGGKSGVIYQLCEALVGRVQIILIDPEGEFAPLRAKFPFVLAGEEGETPATPRTAALLAHTLLELGCSTICDLYELPRQERHDFVRDFVNAMVDAPKNLWHPVLVIIDEAHVFAPEKGQGESVAAKAVEDLATRGRKRGFCVVLATQRLAMLAKTVAANCQNVLVGRTSQVDQVRAAETLHISGKTDRDEFWKLITRTKTGDFFAHGRAFNTDEPVFFHVDRAKTLPEKKDRLQLQSPPAPEAIRALLPQLSKLPQEAEKRAKTEAEMRQEIDALHLEIGKLTKGGVGKEREMALLDEIAELQRRAQDAEVQLRRLPELEIDIERMDGVQRRMRELVDEMAGLLGSEVCVPVQASPQPLPLPRSAAIAIQAPAKPVSAVEGKSLTGVALKLAGIAAGYGKRGEGIEKKLLAVLCGCTMGGTFSARLSEARTAGAITTSGSLVMATEYGISVYGDAFKAPSTTAEVLALWQPKLTGAARQIFDHLVSQRGAAISRNQLAEAVGMSMGGTFSARLSEVRSTGLLTESAGTVAVNPDLLFLRGGRRG